MINYTQRLDSATRRAAWAHEQASQHRKGTDIPYIIHPVGVMMIASNATDDEDTLIACLMHDVLEDVSADIYSESQMSEEFGERVVAIVKDVTKDDSVPDWRQRSEAYLSHLKTQASEEAIIVSASDKIHNLLSILIDYKVHGEELWQRFTTKSAEDQLWWYESIHEAVRSRGAPVMLCNMLESQLRELKQLLLEA